MNKNVTIIFDFGGVLIQWDPRIAFRDFFANDEEVESFLKEINFVEWNAQFDKGVTFAEGTEEHVKHFPQYEQPIRAFQHNWKHTITGIIPQTVEILHALKEKGYPLFGLSNWSNETFPLVRNKYEFFGVFKEIILSGEVKLIKPGREIFEVCLNKVGKTAPECIFIDDSAANIETAKQLGFDTIHFTTPEHLHNELRAREIL